MAGDSRIVIRSAAWYTVSNLLVKASGFITVPIFTRLLTQAEYGTYSNFLSWVSVFGIVTSLSLESTLISAMRDYKDRLASYALSIAVLGPLLAGICWIVALLVMPGLSGFLALDSVYVNAMFLYLMFQPIVNVFQAYERYRFKYKATVASSVAVTLGAAVCSVTLALTMDDSLFGVVAGRVLPMVAIGAILGIILFREGRALDVSCWRYALPIALPFVPHLLSMTLLGSLNKIFITQYCGAEANAIYSIAFNFGLIISTLTSSLNSAFAPWMAEKLMNRQLGSIRKMSVPYVGAFSALAVCACLLAPEIVFVLGGPEYGAAATIVPWISMGCIFQFMYGLYVNIEQFEKKTLGMAVASVSAAVLNAVLDVLLIPRFGYQVAGVCTAISYAWLLVAHMFLVGRIGLLGAYNTKLNVLIIAAAAVASLAIIPLYEFVAVRLVLLVGLGVAALLLIGRARRGARPASPNETTTDSPDR